MARRAARQYTNGLGGGTEFTHVRREGPTAPAVPQPSPAPVAVLDPTANVVAILSAQTQRQDDLRNIEVAHIEEIAALRAAHARELRVAEAARVDAIRAVDQANIQRAADVAALQASTLREQVTVTARQTASELSTALDPIRKDVAELRQSQYELQGQRAQKVEGRGVNQYLITTVIAFVALLLALAYLVVQNSAKPGTPTPITVVVPTPTP